MLSPSPYSITISRRARAGSLTDHQQAENSEFARETAQRKRGSSCVALGSLKGAPQRRILTAISAKPHRGASFLIRTQYSSSALKLAPWVFLLTAADSVSTVVYRAGERIAAARHLATCICGRLLLLPLTRKNIRLSAPRQAPAIHDWIWNLGTIGWTRGIRFEVVFPAQVQPESSQSRLWQDATIT